MQDVTAATGVFLTKQLAAFHEASAVPVWMLTGLPTKHSTNTVHAGTTVQAKPCVIERD